MPVKRRLLLPALAMAIGAVLAGRVGVPAGMPLALADAGLPACQYLDLPTRFTSPADWQRTLVDTLFSVPQSYQPSGLVPVSEAGIDGVGQVRALVIPDLEALASAARAAGTPVAVQSAYRSYAYQVSTFNSWVAQHGYDSALEGSARPGHSEHQLGVAIDFMSAGGGAPWDAGDWAVTPAGRWMAANGWRFGFVMSYPWAKAEVTCYAYEPWHYRYVGRDAAAAIHDGGLTLREYLWDRQGNSVMAGLVPAGSARPSTTGPVPTEQRSAAPSGSPSTTPSPAPAGSERPESGVAAAAGGPDGSRPDASPSDPISPAGIALSVAIGLLILVSVEQANRVIHRRVRQVVVRRPRRGRWDQARRSSSFPSP